MDLQYIIDNNNETSNYRMSCKIESFDQIRKLLVLAHDKNAWYSVLSEILDMENIIIESKRINICNLLLICDKKYGINSQYADLSEADRELVILHMP